jgi:hypothetical protein
MTERVEICCTWALAILFYLNKNHFYELHKIMGGNQDVVSNTYNKRENINKKQCVF